jgi:hypothetical protein
MRSMSVGYREWAPARTVFLQSERQPETASGGEEVCERGEGKTRRAGGVRGDAGFVGKGFEFGRNESSESWLLCLSETEWRDPCPASHRKTLPSCTHVAAADPKPAARHEPPLPKASLHKNQAHWNDRRQRPQQLL